MGTVSSSNNTTNTNNDPILAAQRQRRHDRGQDRGQQHQEAPPDYGGPGAVEINHAAAAIAADVAARGQVARHVVQDDEDEDGLGFPSEDEDEDDMGTNGASRLSRSNDSTGSNSKTSGYWCVVKAKTRQHNSSRVTRKAVHFEVKPNVTFSVGRAATSDLRLEDDRCANDNAILEPLKGQGQVGILLTPRARMYQLVGMGSKRTLTETVLYIGAVIKVGSVSLEVTDMCTDESDNFMERFAVEIDNSYNNTRRKSLRHQSSSKGRSSGADSDCSVDANSSKEDGSSRDHSSTGEEEDGDSSSGKATGRDRDDTLDFDDVERLEEEDMEEDEEEDDTMCYICWGGLTSNVGSDGNDDDEEQAAGVRQGHKHRQSPEKPNPLIQNPCGKCSGSSRYVHLNCLLTWINKSGSGHCSICNNPLPQHFHSPPPNLELKVVRHRRGQSWVGTRRFRISFAERDNATIGRVHDADVRLADRSVGSLHARITFNRDLRRFELMDCQSQGGTFLQVKQPMEITSLSEGPTYLKIGRSLLSIRLTHRRQTLLNLIPGMWGKR